MVVMTGQQSKSLIRIILKKLTTTTDGFGDFWFERQEPETYSLKIEMEGYLTRKLENIDATKDINIGDLELYKKEQIG